MESIVARTGQPANIREVSLMAQKLMMNLTRHARNMTEHMR